MGPLAAGMRDLLVGERKGEHKAEWGAGITDHAISQSLYLFAGQHGCLQWESRQEMNRNELPEKCLKLHRIAALSATKFDLLTGNCTAYADLPSKRGCNVNEAGSFG